MTEINTEKSYGTVQIADEVIGIIAGTAAYEVEGVCPVQSITADSIVDFFSKKNQPRGAKVYVDDNTVSIDIAISVNFGIKIHETAIQVQKKIKSAVETMTGLEVIAVNVEVESLNAEKQKNKEEADV